MSSVASSGRRQGSPLQLYFVALALLFVVVGAAAGGYVYVQSDRNARQAATADANFAARKASAQIAKGLDFIDAATKAIVSDAATINQLFADASKCSLGYAPLGAFDSGHIEIMRLDGTVICSSMHPALTGSVYEGEPWLKATVNEVLAPVFDPATSHTVVASAYRMASQGWLVWFNDLTPIGPKLAAEFGSGVDQLEFMVTSADGKSILARSIDSTKWTGASVAGTPFATSTDPVERTDVNGTRRWYGESTVAPSGWKVYVGADRAVALAEASQFQRQEFGIIAFGVVLTLVALAFVYRQVARPMASLGAAVRSSRGLESKASVPVAGPAEVAALGEDINELISSLRREATERVVARRIYEQLFQGSPLPTILADPKGFAVLEINDAAVAAFGYSLDEFKALSASEFFVAADEDQNRKMQDVRAQGSALIRFGPLGFRKKDGSIMRALVTSYNVEHEGEQARVSMLEDVTEKEKMEARFQQAERLESLGQLAGGVAHDFNNLLAVILNSAATLNSQIDRARDQNDPAWSEAERDLERIEKASQSANRLTRQLLAFARREVVQRLVLDLNEQIAGLTELLRRTLGSHIVLKTSLAEGLWPVMMDPVHLEQIVINLAVNARDAMPKGGTLSISTENVTVELADAEGIPGISPGRHARLRIADSGVGMDQATLGHVFEPFFTTKPVGKGTGLGLATVYGIVKGLNGHVSIYSEVGRGTTVTVLLPATAEAPPVKAPVIPIRREVGTGTVLVVEDYDELRMLFEEILTGAGYKVLSAPDGAAALALARKHSMEIDVLLTDIVMPNMLGPDLAAQLGVENPGLRVLFMSGHAQPALGGLAALPAGVPLLQKPFMGPELLQKLREVLASPPN